ncbi:MAG: serine hydrolase [Cyanosarcina radialis HA8281-LM2]|jgi:beta-lactamase class A|nr:serine hydrolase [Cyanosarcina radialis HA8281-LM2]
MYRLGSFLSTGLLLLLVPGVRSQPVKPQQLLLAQIQTPNRSMTPQAAIDRLFTTKEIQADWFTAAFSAQVPAVQVQQIVNSIKEQLGDYQKVEAENGGYLVILERGSVPTQIALDADGKIAGLLFQPPRSNAISLPEAIAKFKELPGKVSFLVLEGKSEKAALNAEVSLGVGSAFKLAILNVLKSQIATGKRSWRDVVELQSQAKSLPSGVLQTWPDGSLLTVQTLASLMISQSDNTATDTLLYLVGRENVEAIASRNRPFLTTREFFVLKSSKNQDLLKQYRAGSESEKRAVLDEVKKRSLPDISEFEGNPVALDVEWFFTAEELCKLMENVADLPLMSINPGVVNPKDWERVAFKGGSEPGVLNFTTWLQAKNGKTYCVVATWNHTSTVDDAKLMNIYSAAIAGLK